MLFAGDLLENGAVPFFGDGYPLDWPATGPAGRRAGDRRGRPGPRRPCRPGLRRRPGRLVRRLAAARPGVHAGEATLDDAIAAHPFPELPPAHARSAFERALTQLRGDLD